MSKSSNSSELISENQFDDNTYYEDFDFCKFEGVKPVKKYEIQAFFKILSKNKDSVELHIYQRHFIPEIEAKYDKNGNCLNCPNKYSQHKEAFVNMGNYYYQYKESSYYDMPGSAVKSHNYFNFEKKEIIIIELLSFDDLPESYNISKINLIDKYKEQIEFSGEWDESILNKDLDFDSLKKHPQAQSYWKYSYEIKKRGLAINRTNIDLRSGKIISGCDLVRGYPKKSINVFWNLYKGEVGGNVDNRFNNCD